MDISSKIGWANLDEWSEIMTIVVKGFGFMEAFDKWPKLLTSTSFSKNEEIKAAKLLAIRLVEYYGWTALYEQI